MELWSRIRLCSDLGADAIEIGAATIEEFKKINITQQYADELNKFKYVSIHAPWKELSYKKDDDIDALINKLHEISDKVNVGGIVLHWDTVKDADYLKATGLPFLIENGDKRKGKAVMPADFKKLKKETPFGFCLDIQHAYEHDPTMDMAKVYVDVMGDRLKEMHVSGCTKDEIHFPTYRADNSRDIQKILELELKVPKILEGLIIQKPYFTANSELKFIRRFEK